MGATTVAITMDTVVVIVDLPGRPGGNDMGKYFTAWLLGVPAGLLLLFYAFTHLF